MLALTTPLLWYTTRASGTVALVLLTATVVLGILTTTRTSTSAVPKFAISDLHRRVSLLAMVFLGIHIFTAIIDTFVPIGLTATVVPFASKYSPFWVGLGTVAFDLLLAVLVTSLLRQRISAGAFRAVHWLVYISWPVAVAHAIGVGTDLRFGWMQILVAVCLVSVLAALAWRIRAHPYRGGHRTAVPPRSSDQRRPVAASSRPQSRIGPSASGGVRR
ncbi:MAG: ferric reductase-like transmembrane domain-containing protein [Acidimicrobiales bacterium]